MLVITIVLNFNLCNYLISQLKGQSKIWLNTIPISDEKEIKSKGPFWFKQISSLSDILLFSKEMGFDPEKNYSKIYCDFSNRLIVVSASPKFKIEPYLWTFPILGEVPYKGFFNYKLLSDELIELKKLNLDVDTGQVNAYSTLGILSDPIMPGMLKMNEEELAETIFHELVHKYTFKINNSSTNESIAQAFGEELTKKYLSRKYGKSSLKLSLYCNNLMERDSIQIFFREFAKQLNTFYSSPQFSKSSNKEKIKKEMFRDLYIKMYSKSFFKRRKISKFIYKIELSKNAFFADYLVYFSNKDSIKNTLNKVYKGNFMKMMEANN